jgi:AbrB family looped-hinge helix DNA binding protein
MNVKIDGAGRIVLPKRVRERFALHAGAKLDLEERPEGLVLRPTEQSPSMVHRDGIWVHLGKVPSGFRWNSLVDDVRALRRRLASESTRSMCDISDSWHRSSVIV